MSQSYDSLVAQALLQGVPVTALQAHAEGRFTCPDCGDEGPHEVQTYMGEPEFVCRTCGMQHVVPPLRTP